MLKAKSTVWRFLFPILLLQVLATIVFLEFFLDKIFDLSSLLNLSYDGLFITAAVGFNVSVLILILLQLKQLIWKPMGGDPETVIRVMNNIVTGRLEKDDLTAAPDTLLANTLTMRDKLQKSINQLKDNASRLSLAASVFDHAQDGIFITNEQFQIVDVNRSFTKITGYLKEAVIHHRPVELGFGFQDQEYFDKAKKTLALKKTCRGEVWNLHADGNVYASWLDVFSVTDENDVVTNYVGIFSDITEVKQQQINLEHMAYHDPLTQLPNRTLFSDRLKQELDDIKTETEVLAVCYFDLDGFKPVNDDFGHEAGDLLLVEFSKRIRENISKSDTIARLGGDEFALLLKVATKEECVAQLDHLLAEISQPYHLEDESINTISASIGYTIYPEDLSEPETLLRHADHAMYFVKTHGRGFHHQFDAVQDQDEIQHLKEKDAIHAALPNGEFELHYQPKVNMHLGTISGAEALIRWQHPERGMVSPAEFIPIIEQDLNLTIQLGEWVIEEALKQIRVWQSQGLSVHVSVNISPNHMVQLNFSKRLSMLLESYADVPANLLELEITETAVIEDIELVAKTIKTCREFGVKFALDDFGVGYSSLTYLRRLPVEVIKVDQSFVRDMLRDADDLAVVSSVISLGNSFGLDVVAEGVETVEHGVALKEMGCQFAQGYGISRPLPAKAFAGWVKAYIPDASWGAIKNVSNL